MAQPLFINIDGINLEYTTVGPVRQCDGPVLVFLHEGLGCVSLWKDFPQKLSSRLQLPGLVYSRAGYGKSDPVELPRPVNFMDNEAVVLGKLLKGFDIHEAILVGHSDGASISLIYAGKTGCAHVKALILEGPHVFTEPMQLESIARIREAYRTTNLRERLSKHHGNNTDIAFYGWNNVWLNPDFRSWNIEGILETINVPVLMIQGQNDEYGTMRQIEAIKKGVRGTAEVLEVPLCGHSPHREHQETTLEAIVSFVNKHLFVKIQQSRPT